jgi:hypothetical protein
LQLIKIDGLRFPRHEGRPHEALDGAETGQPIPKEMRGISLFHDMTIPYPALLARVDVCAVEEVEVTALFLTSVS